MNGRPIEHLFVGGPGEVSQNGGVNGNCSEIGDSTTSTFQISLLYFKE